MKAKFQIGLASYTGKTGEVVYCFNRYLNTVYVRKYKYPTLCDQQHTLGSISKQIFAVHPSEGYIKDIKNYLLRYICLRDNRRSGIRAWSVLYSKLMRTMAEALPDIDLRTITREYIYEHDLPCISISRAVEAGLLPKVLDWEGYTHEI
ncbi:MAG: hypothetical protein V3576_00980 [Candidatus Cloacimonadota bacterium]